MNNSDRVQAALAALRKRWIEKYGCTPCEKCRQPKSEQATSNELQPDKLRPTAASPQTRENSARLETDASPFINNPSEPRVGLKATGIQSLDAYIGEWRPGSNYVIGGQPASGVAALKITLADNFSRLGGQLLWVGNQDDFRLVTMTLLLREARIEHSDSFNVIQVTEAEKAEAYRALERMCERSIILFDIADVGDSEAEGELLALLSANQPTWVIVEPSSYEEGDLTKLEASEHRRAINKFLRQVQETSPTSSGLWQVNLPGRNDGQYARRPTLDDVMSPVQIENTEVVIFAHRESIDSPHLAFGQAELIVAKNDFGPTGTIPMLYKPELSTWQERTAAHSAVHECEAGYHFELSLRESNDQRNSSPT
jgi:replicative DNA helicase